MPHREFFVGTAAVIGLAPIYLGINAILRPGVAFSMLGFPAPSQPVPVEATKAAHAVVQMYGSRNIFLGLANLAVWYSGDVETFGWVALAGIPVAVIDGFASRNIVKGSEWGHWVFAFVSLGLAGGLWGWY